MQTLSMIAAIDEHNGLGKDNQLLCHAPADLAHFKTITMGKPIIMGRRTYESIGRPLPGRLNIVLSRSISSIPGLIVVSSLDEALQSVADAEEVMIIGGAQLFEEALSLVSRLYITRIHHYFNADVFFPAINLENWRCLESITRQPDEKNPYAMTFYLYERKPI